MSGPTITYSALPEIPLIKRGDDLVKVITAGIDRAGINLRTGDIIAVAQKIVSKAQGRFIDLNDVEPSPRAIEIARRTKKDPRFVEVILSESEEVLREREGILIVVHRHGFVMANAGVDHSNVAGDEDRLLLLPEDPDGTCADIKAALDNKFGVDIGVLINDSFGRAWRNGVVGVALGAAGVPSLRDMVGEPDLFGRPMRVTQVAVADELSAGASLLMGQGAEGLPVVHIRGFKRSGKTCVAASLIRPKHLDLFR
jgi:coenzyme F420-0:L-glutamate ligase / coenzyme F420-1:gamma-L-glutamate ligase